MSLLFFGVGALLYMLQRGDEANLKLVVVWMAIGMVTFGFEYFVQLLVNFEKSKREGDRTASANRKPVA